MFQLILTGNCQTCSENVAMLTLIISLCEIKYSTICWNLGLLDPNCHFAYKEIEIQERTGIMQISSELGTAPSSQQMLTIHWLNREINQAICETWHTGFPSKSLLFSQSSSADAFVFDTKIFIIWDEISMHDEFQGKFSEGCGKP